MNPRPLILAGLLVAPAWVALTQTFSPSQPREIPGKESTAEDVAFNSSFFSYEPDALHPHSASRPLLVSLKFGATPAFAGSTLDDDATEDESDDTPITALDRWTPDLSPPALRADEIAETEPPAVVFALPAYIAPTPAPAPLVAAPLPRPAPVSRSRERVPMYDTWVKTLRNQPPPRRAGEFIPDLKRIFAEEGVPVELAWIPEVESTFDPRAFSRKGARGLFQFMPSTAREQGLRVRASYDERVNPEKSARAAAALLRQLHEEFDSWPLALAAFNAGGSRVRRSLRGDSRKTFADIAHELPLETRLYVPKVLATLAVREGVSPAALAAPSYASAEAGL